MRFCSPPHCTYILNCTAVTKRRQERKRKKKQNKKIFILHQHSADKCQDFCTMWFCFSCVFDNNNTTFDSLVICICFILIFSEDCLFAWENTKFKRTCEVCVRINRYLCRKAYCKIWNRNHRSWARVQAQIVECSHWKIHQNTFICLRNDTKSTQNNITPNHMSLRVTHCVHLQFPFGVALVVVFSAGSVYVALCSCETIRVCRGFVLLLQRQTIHRIPPHLRECMLSAQLENFGCAFVAIKIFIFN